MAVLTKARPRIESFQIQWDSDYGIDRRRGWTVVINGIVAAELAPNLAVAIWRAWRSFRTWE